MNAILLLFLIGVMLLAGEVFVPGAILGVLGGLAMAGGCVLSFTELGSTGGALATLVALSLLGLTLYTELVWLPKTKFGRKLIVESAIAATSQPALAQRQEVVGKMATTLTPLVPSGYVSIEGRRYEAFSQSGHTPVGATVRVAGLDNFRLIVTQP